MEATEDEAVGDVLGMFCRRADDAEDAKGEVEVGAKTDVRDSVLKIDSEADKMPDATVEDKSNQLVEQPVTSRLFRTALVTFPRHDGGR